MTDLRSAPPVEGQLDELRTMLDTLDRAAQEVGRYVMARDDMLRPDRIDAKNNAKSAIESYVAGLREDFRMAEEARATCSDFLAHAYADLEKAESSLHSLQQPLKQITESGLDDVIDVIPDHWPQKEILARLRSIAATPEEK